ncbi:MAG: MATE family efflux transporter, partial [Salinivirgaceae bacterium]|nr:MATE family efflux transporter [Salinivirgaceae bacterium]
ATAALLGFGQGFQPVCGFNYGAGLYERVSRAFKFSVAVSTAYCGAVAAAGIVFADAIVSLFSVADADVISLGALVLKFHCCTYILNGFIVLTNMYLQTTRHTAGALLVAVARQGLFFLPLLVVGAHFYGLMGIVAAQPLSDALTFGLAIPLYRRNHK